MADRDVALTHAAGASSVEGGVEGVDGSKRKRVPSKKYANTQFVWRKIHLDAVQDVTCL